MAIAYDRWGGHCGESIDTFRRFFAECDACKVKSEAEKRFEDVKQRCSPTLSIRTLAGPARIKIDGMDRGESPVTVVLEAGPHRIEAELAGHHPIDRKLDLAWSERRELELAFMP